MAFLFGKFVGITAVLIPAVFAAPGQQLHPKILNPEATNVVPNSYIIGYHDNVTAAAIENHMASITSRLSKRTSDSIGAVYRMDFLKGFQVTTDIGTLHEIASSPHVHFIEKDIEVPLASFEAQKGAPWGLSRISHRSYYGNNTYVFDDSAGRSVTVYLVDSGIRLDHAEFEGRASWGANYVEDTPNTDEIGHGTHCAGIIAGRTFGVAKKASLVAVKAFNKRGFAAMKDLLRSLQYVVDNAPPGSVLNASWGEVKSVVLNLAIRNVVYRGVTTVVAAGNEGVEATRISPASELSAITVGAIDEHNRRPGFSNWGSVVDVFAPGVAVLSAFNTGPNATALMQGTSMAAPHVAGLAAYLITFEGLQNPDAVQQRIKDLASLGTSDVLNAGRNSPDLIAYNNCS